MIEFKQIVGRGTRLFDGKEYFTIYDFVDAYHHFADPEWDGEPIDETVEKEPHVPRTPKEPKEPGPEPEPIPTRQKVRIKLRDGKEREIQHMITTSFWGPNGKPISVQEFMDNLFGAMPEFFKTEEELRKIWSDPVTRKEFLEKIASLGYGKDELESLQKMIDAEESDLFDVLSYISFLTQPISRADRVGQTKNEILAAVEEKQKEFLDFVLEKYEERGVEELDEEKLPVLLNLKYQAIANAVSALGEVESIRSVFFGFQKQLYAATRSK